MPFLLYIHGAVPKIYPPEDNFLSQMVGRFVTLPFPNNEGYTSWQRGRIEVIFSARISPCNNETVVSSTVLFNKHLNFYQTLGTTVRQPDFPPLWNFDSMLGDTTVRYVLGLKWHWVIYPFSDQGRAFSWWSIATSWSSLQPKMKNSSFTQPWVKFSPEMALTYHQVMRR